LSGPAAAVEQVDKGVSCTLSFVSFCSDYVVFQVCHFSGSGSE